MTIKNIKKKTKTPIEPKKFSKLIVPNIWQPKPSLFESHYITIYYFLYNLTDWLTDWLQFSKKSFKIYLYPRNSSWWDVRLWKLWLLGSLAQSLEVFQYIRLSRKCKFCQYLTNSSGAMFLKDFFMFLKWFSCCF